MEEITGRQLPLAHAVHAYQLTGKGGITPISADSSATTAQPFWLHLNYSDEDSAKWLQQTPIIPDAAREELTDENPRPRIARFGDGTLITLRTINFTNDNLPDPLVGLRIYITDNFIVSSRNRLVSAIDEVNKDLVNNAGPVSVGDWLVRTADALTDQASEFIDDIHVRIIELEDKVMAQQVPERGIMALIRKQLIILRRYLVPQRDAFSRLAIEKLSWMSNNDHHRMQEIADRLGRTLDDIDSSVARTSVLTDEINNMMVYSTSRRTYMMSIMAMLFLPGTFLTGLFGVNLEGIPGQHSPWSFGIFCACLLVLAIGIGWLLKRSKWL